MVCLLHGRLLIYLLSTTNTANLSTIEKVDQEKIDLQLENEQLKNTIEQLELQLQSEQSDSTDPVVEPAVGTSRHHPAPHHTEVSFVKETILEKFEGSITVLETIRGSEAWDIIYSNNRFNSPPDEGYEYILAKVSFNVRKNENPDAFVSLSPVDFTLVSDNWSDYKRESVSLNEDIRVNLYEGSSHVGWVAFLVRIDDTNPLITYNRNYDGTGGIWFSVHPN